MIGSLAGIIAEKEPPRVLIEVQGVGYQVEVPMSTYLTLPATGSAVRLRIHHVLREDASLLFGFASAEERELFRVIKRKAVRIHIGQSYPLRDVATAHRDLEARRTTGSTVLIP